jgi:predicted transcriptional regulator
LVHPIKYSRSETELPRFGTFVYSSTEALTESHVFDQILFSSSFINKGPWHLNEDSVQIFSDDHADVGKFVRAVDSDHLPVYAEIKRFMG